MNVFEGDMIEKYTHRGYILQATEDTKGNYKTNRQLS